MEKCIRPFWFTIRWIRWKTDSSVKKRQVQFNRHVILDVYCVLVTKTRKIYFNIVGNCENL